MKKIYCLLFVAICLSSVSLAQTRFGVSAGININNMRETDTSNDAVVGFHAGVLLDCPIGTNLYIQPNLLFTQRGCKSKEEFTTSKTKLNYLQLPIVMSYRYPLGKSASFDVNVGPFLAMGINGESSYDGELVVGDYVYDVNSTTTEGIFKQSKEQKDLGLEATLKRFDAGLRFGAGMHFLEHIGFSVHYDLGVVNILNKEGTTKILEQAAGKDLYSKTGSLQFSLSFIY